jgi:hypothetical protein
MVAYQRVVAGHLEVIFLPETHRRSLYGIFSIKRVNSHRPSPPMSLRRQ